MPKIRKEFRMKMKLVKKLTGNAWFEKFEDNTFAWKGLYTR